MTSTPPASPGTKRIFRAALLLVLGFLLVGTFLVLQPFVTALAWAAVLSFSVWPVYRHLHQAVGGRDALASLLLCLFLAAVLIVPLLITGAHFRGDIANLERNWHRLASRGLPAVPAWVANVPIVGGDVADFWGRLRTDLKNQMQPPATSIDDPLGSPAHQTGSGTLQRVAQVLRDLLVRLSIAIAQGAGQIALSLLFTFFLLKDGRQIANGLNGLAERISTERGTEILAVASGTVRSVVYGVIGTAAIQGILAAIGFWFAGIPGAALLGLLVFALSPVPLGPPLVLVPGIVWLLASGRLGAGIFLIVWSVLVSSIDNVIKPIIISRGSRVPFVLILVGVLGGAMAFGMIGVFLGPMLLAVTFRLVQTWSKSTETLSPPDAASVPSDALDQGPMLAPTPPK